MNNKPKENQLKKMNTNELNLNKMLTTAKNYGVPIIRTESHKFLEKITKKYNPTHILEIGTAIGYSGISMLSMCDGDLVTIEHNKESIKLAKKNFKDQNFYDRVKIISGDCHIEIAKMIYEGKFINYFDMIFLDGPKAQYNLLLDGLLLLLKPNGVFIADNVLFRGYVSGQKEAPTKRYKTIIKRLNEFIENCKTNKYLKEFSLINIEDGLIFARKR